MQEIWDWFVGVVPEWVSDFKWGDQVNSGIVTLVFSLIAAAGGWWAANYREKKKAEPTIDCVVSRYDLIVDLWRIDLAVRNNWPHRATVTAVDLVKPQHGVLFDRDSLHEPDGAGGRQMLTAIDMDAGHRHIIAATKIAPSGTIPKTDEYSTYRVGSRQVTDRETTTLFLYLPTDGMSIALQIDVTIQSHGRVEAFHTYPVRRSLGG